jgi:hypothetical protein
MSTTKLQLGRRSDRTTSLSINTSLCFCLSPATVEPLLKPSETLRCLKVRPRTWTRSYSHHTRYERRCVPAVSAALVFLLAITF